MVSGSKLILLYSVLFNSIGCNSINLNLYFFLSWYLFFIGLLGVILSKKNFLVLMLGLELMFFGNIYIFIVFSSELCDVNGQLYSLVLLILIASESVIGLSLIYLSFKTNRGLYVENISS
jgi:NADH-quinone oxidoreductase subunit K